MIYVGFDHPFCSNLPATTYDNNGNVVFGVPAVIEAGLGSAGPNCKIAYGRATIMHYLVRLND